MAATAAAAAALLLATLACLRAMGRPLAWGCGSRWPWTFDAWSRHTSQHLLDPYSLTHVLHGLLAYAATWALLRRRVGLRGRFLVGLALEGGWELLENTEWVVRTYRANTGALGYAGDTALNSLGDLVSCTVGFWLARGLSLRGALLFFFAVEATLLATARDSLLLNVLLLVAPLKGVRAWQAGG
ncbi:MAG: DUF2585 family protein [Planctomycetota bacterium]|nr:MAG: DUF2585 family protein [Planctomycetota bacterium]